MKFIIQRVSSAQVDVDGQTVGKIGRGYMVLIGVCGDDTKEIADRMVDKMIKLRIFEDEAGKTNLSLASVSGELLLVSQFTLYANCKHGNRPSFLESGSPEHARELYEYIIEKCEALAPTQKGIFGANMKVSLVNDGPFTIMLDSKELW